MERIRDRITASGICIRRLEYQFGDALGTEHKGSNSGGSNSGGSNSGGSNSGGSNSGGSNSGGSNSGGDSTSGGGQATEQTCVFTDEHTDFSAPAGMEGASEDLVTHMNAELVDEFDSGCPARATGPCPSVKEVGKGNLNHLDEDECGFFIKEGTLDTSSVGLKVYFTKDLPAVDVDGTSCSFPTGNQKAIITQFYKASDITATRNTSVPLVKGLVAANAGKLGLTDTCAPFVDRVLDALRRGISKKRFEVAAALATTTSSA